MYTHTHVHTHPIHARAMFPCWLTTSRMACSTPEFQQTLQELTDKSQWIH